MEYCSRNPSGRTLTAVLGIAMVASGCLGTSTITLQPAEESGSRILVEDGEGGHVSVNVTNETGAVVGHVLTDAGFGLSDARVTVWGAPVGATTNATGWFEVLGVPPGKRALRAEHPQFFPAESEVEIRAANVTKVIVTLVPAEKQAAYRPHVHDYWLGRTEVLVIDTTFSFQRASPPGPWGEEQRIYWTVLQAFQPKCVGSGDKSVSMRTSEFYFDDSEQLVWPGTGEIRIAVSWGAFDFVGASEVGVLWKHPQTQTWNWSKAIRSGERLAINVSPEMWDNAHQRFSLWEFRLCAAGKDTPTTAGSDYVGRMFIGNYRVQMTLHRSEEGIPPDPPHPRFWQNGTTIRVVDEEKQVTCLDVCSSSAIYRWGNDLRLWQFRPPEIVPPGTAEVVATLSWTYEVNGVGDPLGLAISPAHIAPSAKQRPTGYEKAEGTAAQGNVREFRISINPDESDSYYQRRSNWVFLWGPASDPLAESYRHSCPCGIKVKLTVDAVRHGLPTE